MRNEMNKNKGIYYFKLVGLKLFRVLLNDEYAYLNEI